MSKHENQRLIKALRDGNDQILNEIYQRFLPLAIHWITKNSGTVAEAKDTFADALMAIFDKTTTSPGFELPCAFEKYLMGIIRYQWFDELKRKKREAEVRNQEVSRYDNEREDNIEQLLITTQQNHARQEKLNQTFLMLSALCQQLLNLYKQGHPPAFIAKELNLNKVDTYYRRKNACIGRWRTLILS